MVVSALILIPAGWFFAQYARVDNFQIAWPIFLGVIAYLFAIEILSGIYFRSKKELLLRDLPYTSNTTTANEQGMGTGSSRKPDVSWIATHQDGGDVVGFLLATLVFCTIAVPLGFLFVWLFGNSMLGWTCTGGSIGLGVGASIKVFKKYTGRD